jgi:O-methyltransferase
VSVDLGTYTGLSTLTIAASTDDDARVWTCDVDREAVGLAQTFWEHAQLAYKIQSRVESAAEFLAGLVGTLGESSVDLVILDANFDQYAEYLVRISSLLKPEGLLLVDDPNWWGLKELVMLEGDGGTRRLKEFLDALRVHPEYDLLEESPGVELLVVRRRLQAAAAPAPTG